MDTNENNHCRCAFCGEMIKNDVKRCPYCGSLLHGSTNEMNNNGSVQVDDLNNQNRAVQSIETQTLSDVHDVIDAQEHLKERMGLNGAPMGYQKIYEKTDESLYVRPNIPQNNIGQNRQYEAFFEMPKSSTQPQSILSNGVKVFLTTMAAIIPGLGQIMGIIFAIVFMNSEDSKDKNSFGLALLIVSLVMFVISAFGSFIVLSVIFQLAQKYS